MVFSILLQIAFSFGLVVVLAVVTGFLIYLGEYFRFRRDINRKSHIKNSRKFYNFIDHF